MRHCWLKLVLPHSVTEGKERACKEGLCAGLEGIIHYFYPHAEPRRFKSIDFLCVRKEENEMEFHYHSVVSASKQSQVEEDILCVTITSYYTGQSLRKEQMEKHAFIHYYIIPSTIYYIFFLLKRSVSSQLSVTQQWHKASISKSLFFFPIGIQYQALWIWVVLFCHQPF